MRTRGRDLSPAFTMVEMLVATAILSLILVITVQMTNSVSTLSTRTRARVETFQEARAAYESVTRKVSQAMLNTYWDYSFPGGDKTKPPTAYVRQSELHFISAPARNGDAAGMILKELYPQIQSTTHAIFFQAPQGYSAPPASDAEPAVAANLGSLLNSSGFYIDYAPDTYDRPAFLRSSSGASSSNSGARWRFRLMELEEPTEMMQVYADVRPNSGMPHNWFLNPITMSATIEQSATQTPGPNQAISTRVLGENVVALVLLPHRSPNDVPPATGTPNQLAPLYAYDSRKYVTSPSDSLAVISRNQLPPLVQVTMVALDERSARRLQDSLADATQIPEAQLGLDKSFVQPSTNLNALPSDQNYNDQYTADLAALEVKLVALHLTYRIFTSDVSILQAKWSEN